MAHDVCNYYFSLWAILCPFTPITAQKTKISENEKSTWRYHHFTQMYQKSWSYWQTVPEIWCAMYVIVTLHLGPFFTLLPQNFRKMKKKKHLDISSFYTFAPKIMTRWCTVPAIWCATDRQTDGLKKWHVVAGASPRNEKQNQKKQTNKTKQKANKKNHHPILHSQVSLSSKFQLQQTILIFGKHFSKENTPGLNRKKWPSASVTFQFKLEFFFFCLKSVFWVSNKLN